MRRRESTTGRTTTALAAALGAAVLGLAGCGGGDEGEAAAGGDTLAEAFGLPSFDDEASQQEYADRQLEVEQAVADCMVAKGFEYTPVDYGDVFAAPIESGDEEEDAIEYARRQGFGIAVRFDPAYDDGMSEVPAEEEFQDPNADYVASLSESEMTAYYEALSGTPEEMAELSTTETDPETGETYEVMSGQAGCQGEAERSVGGGYDESAYSAMEQFYTEIQERVEADPKIKELQEQWRTCMKDAGYDYENSEAVYEYAYGEFTEKVNAVTGIDPNADPFAGISEEEMAAMTEEDFQEAYEKMNELGPDVDMAALEELQEEERGLAVATTTCDQAQSEETAKAYEAVEAAYVEENADRIAEVAAQVKAGTFDGPSGEASAGEG